MMTLRLLAAVLALATMPMLGCPLERERERDPRPEADAGSQAEGEGEGEGEIPSDPFFLAVGYGGRRTSSADGLTWLNDSEDAAGGGDDDNLLRAACAGEGIAVAVGGSQVGRMMVTSDGATFQSHSDDLGWLGGCAVGNGVIIAAGSARAIRSFDGGLTWVDAVTHFYDFGSWNIRSATFLDDGTANGIFAVAGNQGMAISTDAGLTYSRPSGASVARIAAGNGAFVAVGNGARAHSSDGVVWTSEDRPALRDVIFDGTRFVAVGGGETHVSSDGVNWDEQASDRSVDAIAFGVIDGAGVYVGASYVNVRYRSSDAVTWTVAVANDDAGNAIEDLVFVP